MTDAKSEYEGALTSEEVRGLLYDVAAHAHIASLAIQSLDMDHDETLLCLNRIMIRLKDQLEHVAGGYTFDRLSKIENAAKAVAS